MMTVGGLGNLRTLDRGHISRMKLGTIQATLKLQGQLQDAKITAFLIQNPHSGRKAMSLDFNTNSHTEKPYKTKSVGVIIEALQNSGYDNLRKRNYKNIHFCYRAPRLLLISLSELSTSYLSRNTNQPDSIKSQASKCLVWSLSRFTNQMQKIRHVDIAVSLCLIAAMALHYERDHAQGSQHSDWGGVDAFKIKMLSQRKPHTG